MLKRIFILIIFILVICPFYKFSDEEECEPLPPVTNGFFGGGFGSWGIPGGDYPDDNFSFSNGTDNRFYFITPDVLIYKRGYYKVYENPKYGEKQDAQTDLHESAETLLKSGRVLIIPYGDFFW